MAALTAEMCAGCPLTWVRAGGLCGYVVSTRGTQVPEMGIAVPKVPRQTFRPATMRCALKRPEDSTLKRRVGF